MILHFHQNYIRAGHSPISAGFGISILSVASHYFWRNVMCLLAIRGSFKMPLDLIKFPISSLLKVCIMNSEHFQIIIFEFIKIC